MSESATVICRACGQDSQVSFGADRTTEAGFHFPDACVHCQSSDVVLLRNLSREELDEIAEGTGR